MHSTASESLVALQLNHEQKMAARGQARARAHLERSIARGGLADTPAGIAATKRAIEPVAQAISEFVQAAFSGGAGRRHTAAKILKDVDPYLAAYIAVRDTINNASRQESLRKAAITIAINLDAELLAEDFMEENDALYRSVVRNAIARGLTPPRQAHAVKEANRHFNVVPQKRNQSEMCQLGTKLVEVVKETLGIVEVNLVRTGKNTVHKLSLTKGILDYFEKYNESSLLLKPMFLPTLIPPKPWSSPHGGAYNTVPINF